MRSRLLLFVILACITSCTNGNEAKDAMSDTTQSVVTIPTDSVAQPMPVVPMNTAQSNMPVVNPDTGKVVPK